MKKSIYQPQSPYGKVIIPSNTNPWPHELRVAKVLANAGHIVEFIPKGNLKTADILLNGIQYEIKSPISMNYNSLEHLIKKAVHQSPNLIIDAYRIKHGQTAQLHRILTRQAYERKQIKKLILITKQSVIIDII